MKQAEHRATASFFPATLPLAASPTLPLKFAATHYDGSQKLTRPYIDLLRTYNPDFVLLNYRLGLGLGYQTADKDCQPTGDWVCVDLEGGLPAGGRSDSRAEPGGGAVEGKAVKKCQAPIGALHLVSSGSAMHLAGGALHLWHFRR